MGNQKPEIKEKPTIHRDW